MTKWLLAILFFNLYSNLTLENDLFVSHFASFRQAANIFNERHKKYLSQIILDPKSKKMMTIAEIEQKKIDDEHQWEQKLDKINKKNVSYIAPRFMYVLNENGNINTKPIPGRIIKK